MVLNPASAFRVDISVHPVSSEAEDKSLVVYIHLIFLSITSQSEGDALCSVRRLCPCAGSLASPGPADAGSVQCCPAWPGHRV